MAIDLASADELLTTTRAVRKRLDFNRPVPRSVIVDCVRIAQQAPTGSNSQNWRWIVVEDAAKRKALGDIYESIVGDYIRANRKADGEHVRQTDRVYESALYLAERLHQVPVHVIPCLAERVTPGQEATFYGSIYPAVWSFQLALRARGLGTVLTTAHLFKAEEAAKLLGIPAELTQCGLLPVAYTIGGSFKPAARPDPESIIHWNGW